MRHAAILYVENDANDALLLQRAWSKLRVPNPLRVVTDGEEAQRYLAGDGDYANRVDHPMPGLVLLDLKMPRVSGLEVLTWIRARPDLHALPVVVFSSSTQRRDIEAATALRADGYLVKPGPFEEWKATVRVLRNSWLGEG